MIKLKQGQELPEDSIEPLFRVVSVVSYKHSTELAILQPVEGVTYTHQREPAEGSSKIGLNKVFELTGAKSASQIRIGGKTLIKVDANDSRSSDFGILKTHAEMQKDDRILEAQALEFIHS